MHARHEWRLLRHEGRWKERQMFSVCTREQRVSSESAASGKEKNRKARKTPPDDDRDVVFRSSQA